MRIPDYTIRPATLADTDAIVSQRISMFTEMGTSIDADAVTAAFRQWLAQSMPDGTYRAWIVETRGSAKTVPQEDPAVTVVAGGGITILPWPPGPHWIGGRVAFVYNVYTAPAHRSRGLARLVMETIHAWCRANGIGVIGLAASEAGRPLYESMGYETGASPTMWTALE